MVIAATVLKKSSSRLFNIRIVPVSVISYRGTPCGHTFVIKCQILRLLPKMSIQTLINIYIYIYILIYTDQYIYIDQGFYYHFKAHLNFTCRDKCDSHLHFLSHTHTHTCTHTCSCCWHVVGVPEVIRLIVLLTVLQQLNYLHCLK